MPSTLHDTAPLPGATAENCWLWVSVSATLRGDTVTPVALFTVMVTDCEADPPGPVQLRVKMVAAVIAPEVVPGLLVGFDPVQPPLPVQVVAFEVLQVRVVVPPDATTVGAALNEIVGAGDDTVTVAVAEPEPPAPVQSSVNDELALNDEIDSVPLVAFEPDHAPEAVQDVALVLLHVRVVELPAATAVGFAASVTVGCVAEIVTVVAEEVVPPGPVQASVKVASALRGPTDSEPLVPLVPLQPPDAVHEVASVLAQFRVVLPPAARFELPAVSDTVGAWVVAFVEVDGCTPLVQAASATAMITGNANRLLNIMRNSSSRTRANSVG